MRALPIGKAQLRREGRSGLAIIAVGAMVPFCERIAERLDATLINLRFVKPLDEELLLRIAATHRAIVTVEENVVAGGAGSAIAECLAAHGHTLPTLHLGIPDRFIEHGSRDDCLAMAGLDMASDRSGHQPLVARPGPRGGAVRGLTQPCVRPARIERGIETSVFPRATGCRRDGCFILPAAQTLGAHRRLPAISRAHYVTMPTRAAQPAHWPPPRSQRLPIEDVQGRADSRQIPINKVGIKDVFHPVRVKDRSRGEQHTIANFNMYVALPHNFKGTHMSRFVEVLHGNEREI